MKLKMLIVTATVFAMSCASNDVSVPSHEGTLSSSSLVKLGDEVVFCGSEIKIEVVAIDDSRCPSDVVCIHEGHAKVSFHISTINQTVALSSPSNPYTGLSDSREFTANGNTYKLKLKDVIPYPSKGNENKTKTAEFVVTQL